MALLLAAGLLGQSGAALAQGCNVVNVETVIPPDNFGHTVYIRLLSDHGAGVELKCTASFPYPASGETDTIQEKCAELENAVATQCGGPDFGTQDDCAANAKFTVFDNFFSSTLSLGISNDPNIFSQTGQGQAIPDYEGDRIVNSCGGAGFGSNGTFGGTATGTKIREENVDSGIIVFLDVFTTDLTLPLSPPVFEQRFTSIVASSPGNTAASLVATAVADLQNQVANDPQFSGVVTVTQNDRTIEARTSANDVGLSVVAMTDDTGITSSSIGGSTAGIAELSAGPTQAPAFGTVGLVLCGLLVAVAGWFVLRQRRSQLTAGQA